MRWIVLAGALLLACHTGPPPPSFNRILIQDQKPSYASTCSLSATNTPAFACHPDDERWRVCVPSVEKCWDEEILNYDQRSPAGDGRFRRPTEEH